MSVPPRIYLSSDTLLLEKACEYERMSRTMPCRVHIEHNNGKYVTFSYAHDVKGLQPVYRNLLLGPWLSALSKSELHRVFPYSVV